MGIVTTRRAVGVSPINTTINPAANFIVLNAGATQAFYIENASTTDDLWADWTESSPPIAYDSAGFVPTLGNLLNVLAYTTFPGFELYIDEAVDQLGSTPSWINVGGWAITPSLALAIRGFRFTSPYSRVRLVNAGSGSGSATCNVRCSTA